MTEYRRPFGVTEHDDGAWLIQAGNRHLRLSKVEAEELVSTITGRPTIQRYPVTSDHDGPGAIRLAL